MRINAIAEIYSPIDVKKMNSSHPTVNGNSATNLERMTQISFRSGNPNHVAHIVAEEPLLGIKGGGVGTVSNDYNTLNVVDKNTQGKTAKFIPYYNGQKVYDKSGEIVTDIKVLRVPFDLPDTHPLKDKAGTPFFTMQDLDKKPLADILQNEKDFFLLDEVTEKSMQWGLEKNSKIGLYHVRPTDALNKKAPNVDFFLVFTDATAGMTRPYADGSYTSATSELSNSWKGDPYAKASKACQQLMEDSKKAVKDFDPKHIICSDGQAAYFAHNAAIANASGNSYWQDKFPSQIGHNLGDGYIQGTSAKSMIVNLGATPEQIHAIINSPEYIKAVTLGQEEKFLKENVLKNLLNGSENVNAMSIPIHYAKTGYVPMFTTVSEGYHKTLLENPEITPILQKDLIELNKEGKFKGLLNPLNDPSLSPFEKLGLPGFKEDSKLKLANGTEVEVKAFEPFKENQTSLAEVREAKRQMKMNLFDRLTGKYNNAQAWDAKNAKWLEPGSGLSLLAAGKADAKVIVHGSIDAKYIEALNNGQDIKLAVSWGRGDFQKAMDTVMDAFELYAEKDPDTVLIMGGPLEQGTPDYKIISEKAAKLNNNPKIKGRFVFCEGFTPGTALASAADVALTPSRTAPCELTDLEAKKKLCTPIVTNAQGLAQKNFDPNITAEQAKKDAYKTKHEFFTPVDECLNNVSQKIKDKFNSTKTKIEEEIKSVFKIRTGTEISAELLTEKLEKNNKYMQAVKQLRDSMIAEELSDCLERALQTDRNSNIAEEILNNQVNMNTSWEGNGALNSTGESSAELYRRLHIKNNGKNISPEELIKIDIPSASGSTIETESSRIGKNTGIMSWIKHNKKATLIASGTVALAGLGYAGYKKGWFKKEQPEQKTNNLSCIG